MQYRKIFSLALIGAVIASGLWLLKSQEAAAEGAATGGSVKGVIKFEGTAPKAKRLNMNADPVCSGAHSGPVTSGQVIVGANSELANVIVYVSSEVEGEFKAPAESVVLDQKGCLYEPRVLGLFDGQKLEIRNSDKTLHNVHCYKGSATCFNRAMFQGMAAIKHEFKESGNIVKFKCDVHPWMTAYALVAKNPFFAVSGKDGAFEIKGLPAGEHELKAWHEKLGEQVLKVTVKAGAAAASNITFKAAS